MGAPARTYTTRLAQKTMAKFLDAAAQVYGRHGYEGTSIRAIATKASCNLGTLKHYWGSKQALFRELFEINLRPLQQERMRRLRLLEEKASMGEPLSAADVVRAIIEPYRPSNRRHFRALYARAAMDPSPVVIAEMVKIFDEPVQLFISLIQHACPNIGAAELAWRVNCVIGAQLFAEIYQDRGRRFFGPEGDVDEAQAAEWVVHFLMHGVEAAPSRFLCTAST